jgi:hypothetical protein
MHILIVKFRSGLPDREVSRLMEERLPQVRAAAGLLQKFYARETSTGDYVGVHLFDSEESMLSYRNSDLARSIAAVYHAADPPRIEMLTVTFPLLAEANLARPQVVRGDNINS